MFKNLSYFISLIREFCLHLPQTYCMKDSEFIWIKQPSNKNELILKFLEGSKSIKEKFEMCVKINYLKGIKECIENNLNIEYYQVSTFGILFYCTNSSDRLVISNTVSSEIIEYLKNVINERI